VDRRAAGESRPEPRGTQPSSPVFFTCEDVQETYRELSERGVSFVTPPAEMPFGWWAMFEDDESTRYGLHESPALSPSDETGR
jgi:predicted enzyme related to lactoylglutathione lyase